MCGKTNHRRLHVHVAFLDFTERAERRAHRPLIHLDAKEAEDAIVLGGSRRDFLDLEHRRADD